LHLSSALNKTYPSCNIIRRCESVLIDTVDTFSRIIEPLASRCAKFRFKPLVEDVMQNRIQYICQEEGLKLDQEVHVSSVSFFRLMSRDCSNSAWQQNATPEGDVFC